MAKEKKYEFKIKDFCKFILDQWPIMLCCLIMGACASVYSWKHQSLIYEAQATLLLHDKVDTDGDSDEYSQIVNILSSKESYARAGVKVDDVNFGNINISGVTTGVVKIMASGNTEEEAKKGVDLVLGSAEKVLNSVFKENSFESVVLDKPNETVTSGTKKDKILSVAIIMVAAALFAVVLDFIAFSKRTD